MTIPFILNGEDVVAQCSVDKRLVDILRDNFKLSGTRADCRSGICGACSVIFNGRIVPACLIPAFKVKGSEVITIEGFMQTIEYQDIVTGFHQSGWSPCQFCNTSVILGIEALLSQNLRPEPEYIQIAFSDIQCRCIDPHQLLFTIKTISGIRQRRIYGRSI
ncbi:(2Fe-2S)-binding protein [Gracilinema caldarium]|uniref:Ferredoxin n=1 Tax=Gracilinema caldarium (strain ATCC 51460 / DSM 7334 / H1) TaxID=744872 RepID=F8EXL4_GRAC1|nr:2Fe-2S iron-sulfur cluster-binding protein [Gracilinema caldarium]AEJ19595.1 ferredoxin [Gracilinema caldarium DSM 7334]